MPEVSPPEESYHLVEGVSVGIIKGIKIDGTEGFTFINLDLLTHLPDGREVIGRFALPDADAAERFAASIWNAAGQWREQVRP